MPKAKRKTSKVIKNADTNLRLNPMVGYFAVLAALAMFVFGVVFYSSFTQQQATISKYQFLEKIDNQACRYLDGQGGVNGSFRFREDAAANTPLLVYKCYTGGQTQAKEIQGIYIDKYYMGATVTYFATNKEALKYAEEKLNPLRYWGVNEEGQKAGIPQTSKFTFIVTDESVPYFDAYTVKGNAVLRVSLPCSSTDPEQCQQQAEAMLNRELKGINLL